MNKEKIKTSTITRSAWSEFLDGTEYYYFFLVLYKDGPPFYHSSFSVTVRPVCDSDLCDDPIFGSRPLTWRSLSGLNRVTEQVFEGKFFPVIMFPNSS